MPVSLDRESGTGSTTLAALPARCQYLQTSLVERDRRVVLVTYFTRTRLGDNLAVDGSHEDTINTLDNLNVLRRVVVLYRRRRRLWSLILRSFLFYRRF